jgi:glucose/mannose-6-phosphate isomerase
MVYPLDPPFAYEVVRDGDLPKRVDSRSTVIAVSHSGNTSETLNAFLRAVERGASTYAVTSGGKLLDYCKEKGVPYVKIPEGGQPRAMFPYLVTPLMRMIVESFSLGYSVQDLYQGVVESKEFLGGKPKELAQRVLGKLPVVYSSKYFPIAERMKQQFNENSKYPAFYNRVPEIHHNEIEGYRRSKDLFPILIASERIDEVTGELLSPYVIRPKFTSTLKNLASLTYFVDLTSIYLASLLGEDPYKLYVIPKAREITRKVWVN